MVSFRLFGWPVVYRLFQNYNGSFHGYYYVRFSSCIDDWEIYFNFRDLVKGLAGFLYA